MNDTREKLKKISSVIFYEIRTLQKLFSEIIKKDECIEDLEILKSAIEGFNLYINFNLFNLINDVKNEIQIEIQKEADLTKNTREYISKKTKKKLLILKKDYEMDFDEIYLEKNQI